MYIREWEWEYTHDAYGVYCIANSNLFKFQNRIIQTIACNDKHLMVLFHESRIHYIVFFLNLISKWQKEFFSRNFIKSEWIDQINRYYLSVGSCLPEWREFAGFF